MGWDAQLERKVAIKEYLPSDFSTRMPGETKLTVYHGEAYEQFEAGLKRFVDEAQRLAKFNKLEGVVDIYDTFVENNTGYIVMQYLEGQTVKDVIKANGQLPFDTAREIVLKVLETLKEVHKEGVIHRDLSPDNIFITTKSEVKLLDFGAARYATTFHSKSLSVILKPGYAPEEQYRSRGNQGPWSDIYALAATFYKMLTGITPDEAMERAIKDTVQPLSKLDVEISESDENAIMNAMNVRIEERTRTADEFIVALQRNDVQRIEPAKFKNDTGKFSAWLKFASVCLSVAIVIVGVLVGTGAVKLSSGEFLSFGGFLAEGKVNVLGVVNKLVDPAKDELDAIGLVLQIGDLQFSDKVEKDKIMVQSPKSGILLKKGEAIFVVVSAGSEADAIAAAEAAAAQGKVSVPAVKNMQQSRAISTLQGVGLNYKIVAAQEHNTVAKNGVISQSIAAGTKVDPGTVINLVISIGPPGGAVFIPPTTIMVTSISVSGGGTLNVGSGTQLHASVSPNNAADRSVTWSSNNSNVASVSPSGYVTAKESGSAMITAKANDGSGVEGSVAITVNNPQTNNSPPVNPPPQTIDISGLSLSLDSVTLDLNGDTTRRLTLTITPNNATNKTVTWVSNNTCVTVSPDGTITAKSAGSATIIVTSYNGIKASCVVTVKDTSPI